MISKKHLGFLTKKKPFENELAAVLHLYRPVSTLSFTEKARTDRKSAKIGALTKPPEVKRSNRNYRQTETALNW